MRPFDQREIWAHGFKFIVRHVPYAKPQVRRNWRDRRSQCMNIGRYVLFLGSKFLARLRANQISRWVQHYALAALVQNGG